MSVRDRRIKDHTALSFYVDYRLGTVIDKRRFPLLQIREGYNSWMERLRVNKFGLWESIVVGEEIGVQQLFLKQPVTNEPVGGIRRTSVKESRPSKSTEGLSGESVAVIDKTGCYRLL